MPQHYAGAAGTYLKENWLLQVGEYDVGGTPVGVAHAATWNGSIWTLRWEFFCYLGVLALGMTRLLRPRIAVAGWLACWLVEAAVVTGGSHNYWLDTLARFGLMFLSGVIVKLYANRIPRSRVLIAGAVLMVLAGSALADYRLVAALPLAYLLVAVSTYVRSPRLQLRSDISYGMYIYAFPLQQLLAMTLLLTAPVEVFMLVSALLTAVFATASWFAVEKPALALKRSRRPRAVVQLPEPSIGGTVR